VRNVTEEYGTERSRRQDAGFGCASDGSLFNMTVTAVTSGSVLLCFFAAKRFL
jgi:hypothetical protein